MDKEIVWTEKAKTNFQDILIYLTSSWSAKVAEEFIAIVDHRLKLLRIFPKMGVVSLKKPPLRKIILTQYNMLVYRIKGNRIILLNIYDTRRDPLTIEE